MEASRLDGVGSCDDCDGFFKQKTALVFTGGAQCNLELENTSRPTFIGPSIRGVLDQQEFGTEVTASLAMGATLDDLHEAVTTLEDTVRIARRVLGGAHPLTSSIERSLRRSRAALRAREAPSGNA